MTNHPDYAAEARRILEGIPDQIARDTEAWADTQDVINNINMNTRIATAFALLDVGAAIRTISQTQPAADRICGALREPETWGPHSQNAHGNRQDWPCVLSDSHAPETPHRDRDGDSW